MSEDGAVEEGRRSKADRMGLARGVLYALAIEATVVSMIVAWWLS